MQDTSPDIKKSKFAGVVALETTFPRSLRRLAARIMITLIFPLGVWALIGTMGQKQEGAFFILLAAGGALMMLECFANAKTENPRGVGGASNPAGRFSLVAAELWYLASVSGGRDSEALLAALPRSVIGRATLQRLGVSPAEQSALMRRLATSQGGQDNRPSAELFLETLEHIADPGHEILLADIISALFETDGAFRGFFIEQGYTGQTVRGCAEWMERESARADARRRWWSRKRLGRIPGLAKNLAYGQTPFLQTFAQDMSQGNLVGPEELIGREDQLQLIESALLKRSGANVIIVGEPGSGKRALLSGLAEMIRTGTIFPELEHKRVFRLHTASLVAAGKTRGEVQAMFLRLLNETVRAGNIILAIEDFPEFVQSLASLGVSAVELFSPYLASPAIHIIGLANTLSWRRILETETGLTENFEKIELPEPDDATLLRILERIAPGMEADFGRRAVFTYPALAAVAEGATQYLVSGGMPQRAISLMQEVMEEAIAVKSGLILPGMVLDVISKKTHTPLGAVGEAEQQVLLHLEDLLHRRVIGQDEAIVAVADAIRRSRSGIRNPKRPIGTFLFMGPTGVGKTETAKTIAATYFGSEQAMLRFDMSEYHAPDSVERLIGSFERNEPGILASKMRSTPYCVILLDEFEKAHLEVRNLFLQILDEGFFSDYLGMRVNMRNTVIIATSNAGSPLIAELVGQNLDHTALATQVMAAVQQQGTMSPELLNRFDAVIIFRPLDEKSLRAVARLMLGNLGLRLKKQNLMLAITDELVEAVARGGYNPSFGARPMQRFIQDHIEKVIAEKIIRKEIKPGVPFSFSTEELASVQPHEPQNEP